MLDAKPTSTPSGPTKTYKGPAHMPPKVAKVVTPHQVRTLPFKVASPLVLGAEKALVAGSGGAKVGDNPYLGGNFAPVEDERFDGWLEVVEGELPKALNGAFLRNGPNPAVQPNGKYHWFDGDGMVHAVRIKDGKASYVNRYVDTARLRQEREVGYPQFIKFGDSQGVWGVGHALLKQIKEEIGILQPGKYGSGTGNTALLFHAKRLLALHEGDLPYVLRLACQGILETLGRLTYGDKVGSMTAHPKVDPKTGELFFFEYSVGRAPYCWYALADASGALVHHYPVPLEQPVMMHDFALTEDYVIFYDCPLVFDPKLMVKENATPFVFDKSRPSRFGVLPRYAKDASQIRWFEAEPMVAFHTANAWQEGSQVKVCLCTFEEFSLAMDEFTPSKMPYLTEVTMDMSAGAGASASVRRVADVAGDFPRVPDSMIGRKSRYSYLATMVANVDTPYFDGVAKLDLEAGSPSEALVGKVQFGPSSFGGEAYFVPAGEGQGAEDAGYLVTFVHDEKAGHTELVVFDAKTMSCKPVARVRMPRRVPYGFHCLWVSEKDLQTQLEPAHSD
ncbi:hypothetical protein N2152v2_011192 [Parachlorella kessleri]